jgi:hypothetical protein
VGQRRPRFYSCRCDFQSHCISSPAFNIACLIFKQRFNGIVLPVSINRAKALFGLQIEEVPSECLGTLHDIAMLAVM